MTLLGVRKVLLAVPVLAALATWALASTDLEAASVGAPEVTDVTEGTDLAEDVAEEGSVDTTDALLVVSNCTYYNNASHTQVVGQFGYDCCNNAVAWGRKTRFYVCGGCFPCFPPPQ